MNIGEISLYDFLEERHSLENTHNLAQAICDGKYSMEELIDIMEGKSDIHRQRAAWVLGHTAKRDPNIIAPFIPRLIDMLPRTQHNGERRNIIRVLEDHDIPESHEGKLYEYCFNYIADPKEAIAVRCFSLTVLGNLSSKYPELANELITEIELQQIHGSAGFKSRSRKVLKKLKAQLT